MRQKPPDSGKFYVFVNYKGKRRARFVGTEKAARVVADQFAAQLVLGTFQFDPPKVEPPKVVLTFKEYCERWLSARQLKYSTRQSYEVIFENHLGGFDAKPLEEITRQEIKDFITKKQSEVKAGTVRNILAVLRAVLNSAMDDEILTSNPATRVGRSIKRSRANRLDPLTRDEVARLLDTAKEKYGFDVYALLMTAVRTGMRMGELFGLQWVDLDFNTRFVKVQRSFVRGREETPKSGKSRRIDMSKQLSEVLQELKARRREEYCARGQDLPRWVFVNQDGTQLDHSNFRKRVFEKLLVTAGLRRVRFHDLRHTFASLLLQQGESPQYVKEQMGHHSINITVDVYGHLIPGANRRAVDRLDDRPKRVRNVRPVFRPRPVRQGRRSSHGR
jgi:integrase